MRRLALSLAHLIVEKCVTTLTIFTLKLILRSVFIYVATNISASSSAKKKEFVKFQLRLSSENRQLNRINFSTII